VPLTSTGTALQSTSQRPLARRLRSTGVLAGVATAIVGTSCRNRRVCTSSRLSTTGCRRARPSLRSRTIGTDGDVRPPVERRHLRDPAEDVHRYWDLIHEAFNAAGPDASRALGQDIFGTRFRTPNLSRTPVASERSRRSRVGPAAPDDPPAFRPNRPFSRRPRSPNSATSPQPVGRRWTRVTKIGTVGTERVESPGV
jgi:hypothetical protein